MLYRTDFDENGRKTLCQMDGVNADMLMDIFVQKLAPGDTLTLEEAEKECAVLLLSGQVTFAVGNSINETCRRKNQFEETLRRALLPGHKSHGYCHRRQPDFGANDRQ